MYYLNKLGNIKIGGSKNGLPQQYNRIFVTSASKAGEENFAPYSEDFEEGVKSINVAMPFKEHFDMNFDSGLISFIELNESIKYYAKVFGENVLLIPIQPNLDNPNEDLPVINIGKFEDWGHKLDMKNRGILYLNLLSKETCGLFGKSNKYYVNYVGGNGVFIFKTNSAHSISEIRNTLDIAKNMSLESRFAPFKFEIHSKIFNVGDIEEVTYGRLILPNPIDMLNVGKYLREEENSSFVKDIVNIEDYIISMNQEKINKAISLEEASKFFGKKVVFKIDNSFGIDLSMVNTKTNEFDNELLNISVKIAKENKLPEAVIKSLVVKVYEKEGIDLISEEGVKKMSSIVQEIISREGGNLQNVIKAISAI